MLFFLERFYFLSVAFFIDGLNADFVIFGVGFMQAPPVIVFSSACAGIAGLNFTSSKCF